MTTGASNKNAVDMAIENAAKAMDKMEVRIIDLEKFKAETLLYLQEQKIKAKIIWAILGFFGTAGGSLFVWWIQMRLGGRP